VSKTDTHGSIEQAYRLAVERYGELGVDPDAALSELAKVAISLHCWQGDDVRGFEGGELGGGLVATGAYPGRARNADELRADLAKALSLLPGSHRVNLHAIYAEPNGKVERDALGPEHFARWLDWSREHTPGLDMNPTFFSHRKADDGFTLASADEGIRRFWVRHGQACRRIAAHFARSLGGSCVHNIWIPDGYKDTPADRKAPRERLRASLDEVFSEPPETPGVLDSLEGKLFGIGTESYVVGSHDFYLGYAAANGMLLCLDMGHYHPTESVADKVSAVLAFVPGVLLHVSRGVRWDSDHVVTFDDATRAVAREVVRGGYLDRVHIGTDFFDASINRVAAWVIGVRSVLLALLSALLEPTDELREMELAGDFTGRLAMQEQLKALPLDAVWDYYCMTRGTPVRLAWLDEVRSYQRDVLEKRG